MNKTKKKSTRPIHLKIDGHLAGVLRQGARELGFRIDEWARMCLISGDLVTSSSPEAVQYRLAVAGPQPSSSDETA